MRRALAALFVAVVALGLAAPAAPAAEFGAPSVDLAAVYAKPGPFAVGVTTLDLADRKVEVWYPAARKDTLGKTPASYFIRDHLPPGIAAILPPDINPPKQTSAFRDVPASPKGPFPLVTFSHGAAGYREQSTFLTTHLASWGMVVASPDYLEFGLARILGQQPATPKTSTEVLQETVAVVREASASTPGVLSGLVRKGKIGAVGHSAGARASIAFAAADPQVATYVAIAGGGGAFSATSGSTTTTAAAPGVTTTTSPPRITPPDVPAMYIAGREDGIAALAPIRQYYSSVLAPKRLVVITGSGHLNAFSDICTIGEGGGGIVAIGKQAGIPIPDRLARLGSDGCSPPALPSAEVQAVTAHYATAQLRYALGLDKAPVGLAPRSAKQFGSVDVEYRTSR